MVKHVNKLTLTSRVRKIGCKGTNFYVNAKINTELFDFYRKKLHSGTDHAMCFFQHRSQSLPSNLGSTKNVFCEKGSTLRKNSGGRQYKAVC